MAANAEQVEAAILALEAQRAHLGDAVVDLALAPLRAQLVALGHDAGAQSMRLRQATVLFTDIVNSTALGTHLDAEDTAAVLGGALERFRAIVETQQGKVLRFTGDGIKGVFGADGDEENAADYAVRAGLAILAAADAYAETLRARHGVPSFQVRIGVSTGAVVLGGGGVEAEKSAVGTAVNEAAHLERAAPPGGLLINQSTFALVRGMFEVEKQAPIALPGHGAPLTTYVVRRALRGGFRVANRGVAGIELAIVGRGAELARLTALYDAVVASGQMRAVTIVGEPGVGKSRLVDELRHTLRARGHDGVILLARAKPQSRLQPYGIVREMLAAHLRIAETDTADVARRAWRDGFATLIDPVEAEMLGHLVGLDFSASAPIARVGADARQLRDRAFRASVAWLQALAAREPVPLLMLVDDLHWADQGSVAWLRHLMDNASGARWLLLTASRASLPEVHPHWFDGGTRADRQARIDVGPLDPVASRSFAHDLLHKLGDVPPALLDLVTRGGSGNPFYMEELVNMLIDDAVILRPDDAESAWRLVPGQLGAVRVPPTIAGVLQARLDALPVHARTALQLASIIGPVFWDTALDALEPAASEAIALLSQRQMVVPREPSVFSDCREFTFSHHLLHQATYDTVLKAQRRAGHARAGAWLASHSPDRSLEHLGATADHFERAGERVQAAQFFARAAVAARARFANDAALENARRALDNYDPADLERRAEMLTLRASVYDLLGQREAQAATIDEIAALAPPGTARKREASVAFNRALLADRRADYATALSHAREAIALAEAEGLWGLAAQAYGEVVFVLVRRGERERAREALAPALQYARRSGESLPEAQITALWADLENEFGENVHSIELFGRAIALAEEHGHTRLAGLLYGNLGHMLIEFGDVESGHARLLESWRAACEIGNRQIEANALGMLAEAHLAQGDSDSAAQSARQAIEIASAIGDRYGMGNWCLYLGIALLAAGTLELDEADAALARAEETIRSVDDVAVAVAAVARRAEVAVARGDLGAARRLIEPVLAAPRADAQAGIAAQCVEFSVFKVLRALGDARAGEWLHAAYTRLQARAARVPEGPVRDRLLQIDVRSRALREAWTAAQ